MDGGRHFGTYGGEKKTQDQFPIIQRNPENYLCKNQRSKANCERKMCVKIEDIDTKHHTFNLHKKLNKTSYNNKKQCGES